MHQEMFIKRSNIYHVYICIPNQCALLALLPSTEEGGTTPRMPDFPKSDDSWEQKLEDVLQNNKPPDDLVECGRSVKWSETCFKLKVCIVAKGPGNKIMTGPLCKKRYEFKAKMEPKIAASPQPTLFPSLDLTPSNCLLMINIFDFALLTRWLQEYLRFTGSMSVLNIVS